MKVKIHNGVKNVNKRSLYAKFLKGYISSGAFSGSTTLTAAWTMAQQIYKRFPSMSMFDAGRVTGACFKHKPSDSFLEEITGVSIPR